MADVLCGSMPSEPRTVLDTASGEGRLRRGEEDLYTRERPSALTEGAPLRWLWAGGAGRERDDDWAEGRVPSERPRLEPESAGGVNRGPGMSDPTRAQRAH